MQKWRLTKPVTLPPSKFKRANHASAVSAAIEKTISTMVLVKPENEPPANKADLKALIMSDFVDDAKSKADPIVASVVATNDKPEQVALAAPIIKLVQILK